MTAATTPARIVRDGDTEESCYHCRYYTGHTSWCPAGKPEAAAKRAAIAKDRKTPNGTPRRVDLYTMSAERIAAEVIGRRTRVVLWERGAVYGTITEVRNGRTRLVMSDGATCWGPSGRITVR